MLRVPQIPLNWRRLATVRRSSEALGERGGEEPEDAQPTQVDWNPVFHFAGPIAEMITPRRAAA